MLQEPGTSQYDLQFSLFGFPVRVAWGFWLVAAILGWGASSDIDSIYASEDLDSPGAPALLLIWIASLFVSILVHELGHCLAFRYYGIRGSIVLYHFGGLAVPSSFGSWDGARQRRIGPREQIVISAAGPGLQLLLGMTVWLTTLKLGYFTFETQMLDGMLGTNFAEGSVLPGSAAILMFCTSMIFVSVFWAILNLAPLLPLDGGQIMRSALMLSRVQQPLQKAYMVSVFTGGAIGLYFLTSGQPMAGIMFLMFAASNWQAMQSGFGGF